MVQNKKLIVGIDIAKMNHVVSFQGENIKTPQRGIKVSNTAEGFGNLVRNLSPWDKNEVIIGMEPTGHYWKPLYCHLTDRGLSSCTH